MLPAAARMRHPESFQTTVRTGRRARSSMFTVHLSETADATPGQPPQVGFVVTRKVGSSVARNRVRRQLRHVVRAHIDRLEREAPGGGLVVRVAPNAVGASSAQLDSEFTRALDSRLADGPAR
jgi:ribonuclease P protein component